MKRCSFSLDLKHDHARSAIDCGESLDEVSWLAIPRIPLDSSPPSDRDDRIDVQSSPTDRRVDSRFAVGSYRVAERDIVLNQLLHLGLRSSIPVVGAGGEEGRV